jgi:hypothetical protein
MRNSKERCMHKNLRKRAALFGAVAAFATMAFGASSAQAIDAEFDNAFLKVGGISGNGLDICCDSNMAPDVIEFNNVTPTTAPPSVNFIMAPGDLVVPQFSGIVGG